MKAWLCCTASRASTSVFHGKRLAAGGVNGRSGKDSVRGERTTQRQITWQHKGSGRRRSKRGSRTGRAAGALATTLHEGRLQARLPLGCSASAAVCTRQVPLVPQWQSWLLLLSGSCFEACRSQCRSSHPRCSDARSSCMQGTAWPPSESAECTCSAIRRLWSARSRGTRPRLARCSPGCGTVPW